MAGRVRHRKRGPVEYRRSRRAPEPRPDSGIAYDQDLLAALREPGRGNHLPAVGACYDCGREVSGERRYCGPCLAKHPSGGRK